MALNDDSRQYTTINVRSTFIRIGPIEMAVREDGGLLICASNSQRLDLDQVGAEILAGMFKMVTR